MKISFKYTVLFAGLLSGLLAGTGCKKQLDINRSPNAPGVDLGTPKLVFPAAVAGTFARTGGDLAILGAIWGEYATQSALSSQYRQMDAYNLDGSQLNGPYTGMFSSGLKNYQFIIDKAEETGDWNFYLMATVMKAYTAGILVDLYDKIPYTEAFKGADNLTPAFDDGQAIYTDLINSIDEALSKDFDAVSATSPGKFDLIFPPASGNTDIEKEVSWLSGNNIQRWIEFANTLKLKLYLRMVNANPTTAQSGIEQMYTDGATFLTTNAGVAGFQAAVGKQNPMYEQNIQQLNTPDNLRASVTMVSFLRDSVGDPRINYFYGNSDPGAIHQGDFLSTNTAYGSAARLVQRQTDPVIFISAAESYFLQAEARERYFAGAGAKTLYDQGVLTSFSSMGQNGTSFIAPGGVYEYPTAGTLSEKIEAIITQKWIDFGYGVHYIEAFFEKQRTGFPVTSPVYSDHPDYLPGSIVISKNSVLGAGLLPRRLVFPDVEKTRNPNTPATVPITTKVWWAL